ncbi:MAG: GNAT family N-acetyltransferase [Cyanobacteria bacterium]|nr:GNAT family N-acetyltransferase [Cyanobacteria bacterium CG_2015-16_32_12]NCO79065.1 GNAT family N-acetyltransferase [Cyanobacteria bacterium CG_2015-22_32_23]NCQ05219.1 GNAT family N-acetyltransferase [Cyanobacteria bacterium CG_2015-09_32_10]NCQ42395.1 GNAT family N-acetyltransferase [Cyanobacteria bacterium CG_2015-04_32_10]NCS86009.1 GNAT family N-acetyltransferase [Cyanobacteria bacterium CG_2015-02_32_10]
MFRLAVEKDFDTLRHIYSYTVTKLAPSLYSPSQVMAWSSASDNISKFHDFIFDANTYLLIENDEIIGFCGLKNNGYIASFYIHPHFTRQGYGTKLLSYVLDIGITQAVKKFYTEASFFSQPVFSRCGFTILEMETVFYGDVSFERYKMEKITP